MRTFAHVEAGAVKEIIRTAADIATLYPPSMVWIDVTDLALQPDQRWTWDGTRFTAPPTADPRVQALAALEALSAAKAAAGVLFQAAGQSQPTLFPTDAAGRASLLEAMMGVAAGVWADGTPWKVAGAYIPMTAADVQVLAKGAFAYVAGCLAREAVLAVAIAADPSADVTAGWPSNELAAPTGGKAAAPADAVQFDVAHAVEI